MGCGDVRLLRTIGGVDFTGQERAALNKLTNARQLAGGGGPMSRPSDIHPAIAQTTERDLSLFVRKQFVPFRLHDERLDRQIETVPSPQLRETVRHLGQ